MSHYPVHDLDSAPAHAKPVLEAVNTTFGFIPNLLGIMAHSPALAEAYMAVSGAFEKTDLTPTERQVVLLTVSQYHSCHYCVAAHSAAAALQNVSDEIVESVRNDAPIADNRLEALRLFVIALLDKRGWLDDKDKAAFFAAGYEPHHVFDVLVGVAQKTLSNFTNHIADTPLDEAFKAFAREPDRRRAG